MQRNPNYVHFEALDKNELLVLYQDASMKFYSNHDDFHNIISKFIAFKDKYSKNYKKRRSENGATKRAYKNIYAISMRVLLPFNTDSTQKHSIARSFLFSLDKRYKIIPFAYSFYKQGKGEYILFICLTRRYFKNGKTYDVLVKKDTYVNSQTGKLTGAEDPFAVQVSKKGDKQLDKNGNVLKISEFFHKTEIRTFHYKSFSDFRRLLSSILHSVLCKILNMSFYTGLKKKYNDSKYTLTTKRKVMMINNTIERLDKRLADLYVVASQTYFDWEEGRKRFYALRQSINTVFKNERYSNNETNVSIRKTLRYQDKVVNDKVYSGLLSNLRYVEEKLNDKIEEYACEFIYDETLINERY